METTDGFDLVVIGGGTGGYSAALRGADLGLSVALVERAEIGGTCLNRGCIPTKALLHAAELVEGTREGAERWGIRASVDGIDYPVLAAARDDVVAKNVNGLSGHLKGEGVTVIQGDARLASPREVVVGDRRITANKAVVLATGSVPAPFPGLPVDGTRILTSDEALRLDHVPASAVVVGAGSVGVEFASLWNAFGTRVTLVEALPSLLPLEDADLGRELARTLKRKGIDVMTAAKVVDVAVGDGGVKVTVESGGKTTVVESELLLSAIGRRPVTGGMGFEEAGVKLDRGYVVPASWDTLQTDVDGVYAVGDILPPPSLALAHASFAEGMRVAEHVAGARHYPFDYSWVPRVTYSSPEVAAVGLTEEQARARGGEIVTNRMPFNAVARGLMLGQGGFVKVVAEQGGEVLGIHLIGARVSELVAEALLIRGWGAWPDDVAYLIHPHPTLSEAIGEAHLTLAGRRLHQVVMKRATPQPAATAG
ncbi:MAG TPA: dihydrolipoyl dehydrogenase [Candidatus Dormibacteraeota bacterium]|jgi:dihydrolipoamide dehydrogenase|nr:dihydrolipoyl dehydrogenase [Candidatus Dormibacteraeota bacterium]